MQHPKTTLITGGTGKTGRRIAQRLTALGQPVRIGSRSADVPFDWEQPATWGPALQDVGALYLCFQPDLAIPGAVGIITAFVAQAAAAGVQRVVLLSGRGEEAAQACEQVVMASGMQWTVVRASWFNQNFSEGPFLPGVQEGAVAFPAGTTAEPFIDVEDIADIAAAALTEDGHAGELYEVTGPRLMTFADAVQEIGAAAGRDLRFIDASPREYLAGLLAAGVPAPMAEFLVWLSQTVLDGRNSNVTDGVQRALGRPARDFGDYVRTAAATGVWSAS